MTTSGTGFLAIWSDVSAATETDYVHWLTREHAAERLSVPGFLGVRFFRAQAEGLHRYFILYRLADAAVMASPDYLARLNAPTPWSQRIMPILGNFVRGGGRFAHEEGHGSGSAVLPVTCTLDDLQRLRDLAPRILACDRVVAVRLLEVDAGGTRIHTREKSIRQDDKSFAALAVFEALDDPGLDAVESIVAPVLGSAPRLRYRQVYSLTNPAAPRG